MGCVRSAEDFGLCPGAAAEGVMKETISTLVF